MTGFANVLHGIEHFLEDEGKVALKYISPVMVKLEAALKADVENALKNALDAALSAASAGNGTDAIFEAAWKVVEQVAKASVVPLEETALLAIKAIFLAQ